MDERIRFARNSVAEESKCRSVDALAISCAQTAKRREHYADTNLVALICYT